MNASNGSLEIIAKTLLNLSFLVGVSLVSSSHGELRKWYPQLVLLRHAKSLREFSARSAFLLLILITLLAHLSPSGDRHPWHYSFVLPDGYVGWIEIVYSDGNAPLQPPIGKEYRIEISEDGIFRTGSMRVVAAAPKDIFLYRSSNSDGTAKLTSLPPE